MDSDGPITYRPATLRDAQVAAALVSEGFATYRDFAPPGWQPPSPVHGQAELHRRLSRGDVHARLALAGGGAVGFASWVPAFTTGEPRERIPGRAHLGALFVRRPLWGTGLAAELLRWAVDGMRASGFAEAQLWTPRDHARARAFYEREGWSPAADSTTFSPDLRLDLIRYERRLL